MSTLGPTRSHGPAATARDLAALIGCLALVYSAMTIGAIASVDAAGFYARLAQPSWAPPSWVFGPVWTVLYTLMGLALWRVWRSPGPRTVPISLFLGQLAVNAAWSWLFFRWHFGALAVGWIVLLGVMIIATIVSFRRVNRTAAALLGPYLAWVIFAAALNAAIWQMNPAILR